MQEKLKIDILHEDDYIVVINKPPYVVSSRADTVKGETLQDWFSKRIDLSSYKARSSDEVVSYFVEREGLVHRLDKETSGVMVFAKTPESFADLLLQFKDRKVEKEYTALTHGLWKAPSGEIVLPIGRARYNRKVFSVSLEGKQARTEYEVLKEFDDWDFPQDVDSTGYQGFSLVRFSPRSGRTHQIRVHSMHVGHPVVSDYLYAGKKRNKEDRKWAKRVMLHARSLNFFHPANGERVTYRAPYSDMKDVMWEHFSFKL